jgi:hypothetical protein
VAGCGATCLCSDQVIPFVTHATKHSPISHWGAVYLFQQEICHDTSDVQDFWIDYY